MKKIYSLLSAAILTVGTFATSMAQVSVWDGSIDKEWNIDAQGRYMITSAAELAGLADAIYNSGKSSADNYSGTTFVLTTDIDLNNRDWRPIGHIRRNAGSDMDQGFANDGRNSREYFNGTLDGQGHTIKNYKVKLENNLTHANSHWGSIAAGLFGAIKDATIKNLHITGANVYVTGNSYTIYAGALTGWSENSTIANISVANSTIESKGLSKKVFFETGTNKYAHSGGVCGNIENGSTIKDCYSVNNTVKADGLNEGESHGPVVPSAYDGSFTEERICTDKGTYDLGWRNGRIEAAILAANFGGNDAPYYWNESGITPHIFYVATLDNSQATAGSIRQNAVLSRAESVVTGVPQSLDYTYEKVAYKLYTPGTIVTAKAYLEGFNGVWVDPGYFVTGVMGAEGGAGAVLLQDGSDENGNPSYSEATDRFLRVQEFFFEMPAGKTTVAYSTAMEIPSNNIDSEVAQEKVYAIGDKVIVETAIGNTITIFDMTGRVVYNGVATAHRNEIALHPGMYIANGVKVIIR